MKKGFFLIMIMGLSVCLCACGRKSKPEAPRGSFYPHAYIVTQDD